MAQKDNPRFTDPALAEIATLLVQVRDAIILAGIAAADPDSDEGLKAQSILVQLALKNNVF